MAEYLAGVKAIWWSLLTATEHPPQEFCESADADVGPTSGGVLTGVLSVVVVAIALLVFAGFTLYWAR